MRLIDADALNYTMLYKENWINETGVEAPAVWKSDIDNAPTIEPERKTGRWIRIGGTEKCSVCGYTIDDEYYLGNFCQNCGARMEVEK